MYICIYVYMYLYMYLYIYILYIYIYILYVYIYIYIVYIYYVYYIYMCPQQPSLESHRFSTHPHVALLTYQQNIPSKKRNKNPMISQVIPQLLGIPCNGFMMESLS